MLFYYTHAQQQPKTISRSKTLISSYSSKGHLLQVLQLKHTVRLHNSSYLNVPQSHNPSALFEVK